MRQYLAVKKFLFSEKWHKTNIYYIFERAVGVVPLLLSYLFLGGINIMGRKNAFKLDVVSIRLVHDAPMESETAITSPEDAIKLVGSRICDMDREVMCVINLRGDHAPINCNFVSMGAVNYVCAHPREMLKSSILCNSAGIIMCHNHPSGNYMPSDEDITLTVRMRKLCELIRIPLIDHIIIGNNHEEYFSFKDNGLIKGETDY